MLILCNGIIPQLFWWEHFRRSMFWLWAISFVINVGMWLERFVILMSLQRIPWQSSAWGQYCPTFLGPDDLLRHLRVVFHPVLPVPAAGADDLRV